ncbi:MAG TPA: menaquinone biosynthesis protein [Desulfitobacteriaceae bacterium]|nr:menaquinone biosynthesis protein [Desulfitobacteriaceae bacterium]
MIRIGHNPNTNMLPIFHFLPQINTLIENITAEPAEHNAMLADGIIDMAPISSFSLGEHWREYFVFPDLSISARGQIGSILLFSKVPLTQLQDKTIALTDFSATSANLVKILLHKYYRVFPKYITITLDLPGMLAIADAALLIGDLAIQAALGQPDCLIYDLGEEWFKITGCTMTYAVWAFPKKLVIERSHEVAEVYNLLLEAKEKALNNIEEIVNVSMGMLGGSKAFWQAYFEHIYYGLNQEYLLGLKTYFDFCYELGNLTSNPSISFWP